MGDIIRINTDNMRQYAGRIDRINGQLTNLDYRLNRLYWQLPCDDLWTILQADMLTGYSYKLKRCSDYLKNTAEEFDYIESIVKNCDDILNYQGILGSIFAYEGGKIKDFLNAAIDLAVEKWVAGYETLPEPLKNFLEDEWSDYLDCYHTLVDGVNGIVDFYQDFYENNLWYQISVELVLDVVGIGADIASLMVSPNPLKFAVKGYELINDVFKTSSDLVALAELGIGSAIAGEDEEKMQNIIDNHVEKYRNIEGLADVLENNGYKEAAMMVNGIDFLVDSYNLIDGGAKLLKGGEEILDAATGEGGSGGKVIEKTMEHVFKVKPVETLSEGASAAEQMKRTSNIWSNVKSGGQLAESVLKDETGEGLLKTTEPGKFGDDINDYKEDYGEKWQDIYDLLRSNNPKVLVN